MRFRKSRGKRPAQITLTENEIVEACYEFLRNKGHELGNRSLLMIPVRDKKDSLGRKRRRGIEFRVEAE